MSNDDDVRKMYDKPYLGAWDIPEGGVTAIIHHCEQGELPIAGTSRKERKPILYFQGQDRGMILNATNMKAVAGMYGFAVSKWPGKPVRLVSMKVEDNKKNLVDAIRISPKRPVLPKTNTPVAPAEREPGDDEEEDEVAE